MQWQGTPPPGWEETLTLARPSLPRPRSSPRARPSGRRREHPWRHGQRTSLVRCRGPELGRERRFTQGPGTNCTSRGSSAWRLGARAMSASPTGHSRGPQPRRGEGGATRAWATVRRSNLSALQGALGLCPGPDAQRPGARGPCSRTRVTGGTAPPAGLRLGPRRGRHAAEGGGCDRRRG